MNIAFDCEAVMGPGSRNRGIGNYTVNQIRSLVRLDRENRYFFFNVFGSCDYFTEEVEAGLLTEVDYSCVANGRFLYGGERRGVLGELVRRFLRENSIDLFYVTSPFDRFFPVYEKEWFEDCRVCATCYDIIPWLNPEHYLSAPGNVDWYQSCVSFLRSVDRILVISESVRTDLCTHLDFSPETIDVIWGAVGDQYREIDVPESEKDRLFNRYGIDSPYVMCTGGDDERKNIASLIRAFAMLPRDLREQYQLVVVCKLQQTSVERYSALAEELGIGGRLVLTNFVPDEELLELYNLAELVAFPSTYEGFGLPVVEAWSCGTPVLTSNNSSLVEIAGDAAVLVDPFRVESIAEGLHYALTEADLPELTRRGQKRISFFNWERVSELTRDAFRKLAPAAAKREPELRQKIAFFSPLPPKQSGISDYSVDILSKLAQWFDIDIFIDEGYEPDCPLPEHTVVYPHTVYEQKRGGYSETVFQMGNSEYHFYMWEYIRRYGGMVVLHDFNLHGAVICRTIALGGRDDLRYRDILLEDLPFDEAEKLAERIRRGESVGDSEAEINGFVTNYARKIIVHSREAEQKLKERSIGKSVRRVCHYARIDPLPDKTQAREELGVDKNAVVFAAFGHVHWTKRALPQLRAFSAVRKKVPEAKLVFAGKLDPSLEADFWKEVERLKLKDAVTVTGYIELDEFTRWIDATDVCMNLRWPYNGETSGSLMRILAKGRCVVVNDVGSFGEIPEECCCRLPSVQDMNEEEEVQAITAAMLRLAEDPAERERLERSARAFAEEHLDLNRIAEQYRDYILEKPRHVVTENLAGELAREAAREGWSRTTCRKVAETLALAADE